MRHTRTAHQNRLSRSTPRAFSLLEVLISLPILAMISFALVTSVIFAARTSRVVSNQIAAKNIAQSFFERMAIDDYEDVTPGNYPSITTATSPPLYLDSIRGTRCAVDILVTGYGAAEAGSANSLTDNQANWRANEWAGDTLFLNRGPGRGQRAQIASNTANQLTLAAPLAALIAAGSEYEINGGKTVQITTQWRYLGKAYRATIESLVVDWGPRR